MEAVLSDTANESEEGGGPKTIKLKRPSEVPTAKVSAPSAPAPSAAPEAEAVTATGGSPTQKKTVIVKRPPATAAGRKLTFARPQEQDGEASTSAGTGPGPVLVLTHGGVIGAVEGHLDAEWVRVPNLGGREVHHGCEVDGREE